MSELSKLKQQIRNLKTTYNNQKNRAKKFEKLYKEEKQSNLEKDEIIKELKQKEENTNIEGKTEKEDTNDKRCFLIMNWYRVKKTKNGLFLKLL